MIDSFRKIAANQITWLVIPSLLVALPMLIFGHPGFYGDDFHFFKGKDHAGSWGYISSWLSNYGMVYRPVGITLETFLYVLFGWSASLIYWVSMGLYISVVCVLFSQLNKLTANLSVSAFVALFFALFPFNPTAFLQLSSMYMIVACLFTIMIIGSIAQREGGLSNRQIFVFAVLWLALLLTYEQVTGLVAVVCLLLFFVRLREGTVVALKGSWMAGLAFCLVTAIFVGAYLVTPNNPKMVSLKKLNQSDTQVMSKSSTPATPDPVKQTHVVQPEGANPSQATSGRFKAISARGIKAFGFLSKGIGYGWYSLMQQGLSGGIVAFILLSATFLALFIPITPLNKGYASVCALIGLVWTLSTIAPFLLYKAVHIPPYTLLLPGVGIGLLCIGAFWMVWPTGYERLSIPVLKCGFALILLVFSLLQYSYYFGLREELSFWQSISTRVQPIISFVEQGQAIQINGTPEKNNVHIFWLEKAVGIRYFLTLLGEKGVGLKIHTDHNVRNVRISSEDFSGPIRQFDFNPIN